MNKPFISNTSVWVCDCVCMCAHVYIPWPGKNLPRLKEISCSFQFTMLEIRGIRNLNPRQPCFLSSVFCRNRTGRCWHLQIIAVDWRSGKWKESQRKPSAALACSCVSSGQAEHRDCTVLLPARAECHCRAPGCLRAFVLALREPWCKQQLWKCSKAI